VAWYVDLLNRDIPFSFSRFGDGEWNAMLGKPGRNCDGHEYFPEMGDQLRKAVINNLDYIYAIQNMAIRNEGRRISQFLRAHKVSVGWHNADTFHYANIEGGLYPLIAALRKKPVVLVGPSHLRDLRDSCFPYDSFIEVPPKNCFQKIDEIREQVLSCGRNKKGVVFSLSASMPANILVHTLYPVLGKDNWLIDFGSLWDIYVGVQSRQHYEQGQWEKVIKKNLGQ
jgi:hypothetical protein